VAIVNHRSRMKDFDVLVKEVLRLGELIQKERTLSYYEMKNKVA